LKLILMSLLAKSITVAWDIQGVNKIMEEFVLAILKELQLATLNIFVQFVYTLWCSYQWTSDCVGDSPCEKIGKWETCPILKGDRLFVRV
jgi:hypothetical protein